MANTDIISKLYAKEVARKLSDAPKKPFSQVANFKYEGELKRAGDTVYVPVMPKITLGAITDTNADITVSDRTVTQESLVVNNVKGYREKFSNLEEVQTAYSIGGERTKDTAEALNTEVEKGIIAAIDAAATATSSMVITKSGNITPATITSEVMKLRTALSKAEVPYEGRYLIVSPEMSAIIAQAGILSATNVGAESAVEGFLGKFAGFTVLESNLITNYDFYAIHAGSVNAVRQLIASKITEAEGGFYYNVLCELAMGAEVFNCNRERVYVMAA